MMTTDERIAARQALLRFMEWWSEEYFCAGWLVDLEKAMTVRRDGPDARAFEWLVDQAGGWWVYEENRQAQADVRFVPGTFADLAVAATAEKGESA